MKKEQPIDTLRINLFEAGHCKLNRSWNYKRLASPFSRIYLIEEGEAVVRHSGETHTLHAGDLHLVPCYVTADYSCPNFHTQYYVGFAMRLDTGIDLFSANRCELTLKADDFHYRIFRQMTDLLTPFADEHGRLLHAEIPLATAIESRGLLLQIASTFLKQAIEPTELEKERLGRFAPVLQFIEENIRRDISLETLAELSGLTPTYFSDLFFKTLGCRPVEFMNRRRIERAQLLLSSTDLTVQEISYEVGINSAAYFSRLFHKVAGVPPRRYRKLLLDL